MNADIRFFVIFGGLSGISIILYLALLIRNSRRTPHYTLAEAYKISHDKAREVISELLLLIITNVVGWFLFGSQAPFNIFLFVILGIDSWLCLRILIVFQLMMQAKRRIKELRSSSIDE